MLEESSLKFYQNSFTFTARMETIAMKQVSYFIGTTAVDNYEIVGRFYKIVRSNSSCYEKRYNVTVKDRFSVRKETSKLKLL